MDQPTHQRKPSIFWPLILIAVGVVFLLDNLNIIPGTIWDIIARYWPVILILMSLENLLRGEGFFGPIFMIGVASIFQLSILGTIQWDIWEIILRFWPVLIIVLGLDIILGRGERRSVPGMIIGLVVIAAIVAGIVWYTGFGSEAVASNTAQTETVSAPLDGAAQAKVTIDAPLAELSVKNGAAADKLAEGTIGLSKTNSIRQSYDVQGQQGVLTLATSNVSTFAPGLRRAGAAWVIMLNESIPLDMDVSSVFSKTSLDFARLKLDGLSLDNVFSTTVLSFPATDDFDGSIHSVFSTLTIQVPEDAAVRITIDGFLNPTDLPDGYTKDGDQILSPAATASGAKTNVTVNLAFSTLKIITIP